MTPARTWRLCLQAMLDLSDILPYVPLGQASASPVLIRPTSLEGIQQASAANKSNPAEPSVSIFCHETRSLLLSYVQLIDT